MNECLRDEKEYIFNPKIPRYEKVKGITLYDGSTTTGAEITEKGKITSFDNFEAVLIEAELYNRQTMLITEPSGKTVQFLQNSWGDTVYFINCIVSMSKNSFTVKSDQTFIYEDAVDHRQANAKVIRIIGFKNFIRREKNVK